MLINESFVAYNFNCPIQREGTWGLLKVTGVTYTVKLVISRKWRKTLTSLQPATNRNCYPAYRVESFLMTLSDFRGHSPTEQVFSKSISCTVFDKTWQGAADGPSRSTAERLVVCLLHMIWWTIWWTILTCAQKLHYTEKLRVDKFACDAITHRQPVLRSRIRGVLNASSFGIARQVVAWTAWSTPHLTAVPLPKLSRFCPGMTRREQTD